MNSTTTSTESPKHQCRDAYTIPTNDNFKIRVVGSEFIIGELKFYRYPLSLKAVYDDLGRYNDGPGNPKLNFSNGYINYPGYYRDNS